MNSPIFFISAVPKLLDVRIPESEVLSVRVWSLMKFKGKLTPTCGTLIQ